MEDSMDAFRNIVSGARNSISDARDSIRTKLEGSSAKFKSGAKSKTPTQRYSTDEEFNSKEHVGEKENFSERISKVSDVFKNMSQKIGFGLHKCASYVDKKGGKIARLIKDCKTPFSNKSTTKYTDVQTTKGEIQRQKSQKPTRQDSKDGTNTELKASINENAWVSQHEHLVDNNYPTDPEDLVDENYLNDLDQDPSQLHEDPKEQDKSQLETETVLVGNQDQVNLKIPDQHSDKVKESPTTSSQYLEFNHQDFDLSDYKGENFQVKLVFQELAEIPEFHLVKLSEMLEPLVKLSKEPSVKDPEDPEDPRYRVIFLENDLSQSEGFDAGGPTRDYLNGMFEACIKSPLFSMSKVAASSLFMPKTQKTIETSELLTGSEKTNPMPALNEEEIKLYQSMGKIIMHCYNSKTDVESFVSNDALSLGRHFDDGLFKAALCLTSDEINTPFENLKEETKLKMCNALLQVSHEEHATDTVTMQRMTYLKKITNNEPFDRDELPTAASHVFEADCLPSNFLTKDDDPDIDAIMNDQPGFKKALLDYLFFINGDSGQMASQLAPIHAIAQGMKSFCAPGTKIPNDNDVWNSNFTSKEEGYVAFSTKVQGSINRADVIARIELIKLPRGIPEGITNIMENKVKWLKDWLQDKENGATDDEFKSFLKYMVGSSSLPEGKKIEIKLQSPPCIGIPRVHTCSFEMELSPETHIGLDDTKENFIKTLKDWALNTTSYQIR
jgi:hypothetical protein